MSAYCSCARRLNNIAATPEYDFALYDIGGLDEALQNQLTEVVCMQCGSRFYAGRMETLKQFGQENP